MTDAAASEAARPAASHAGRTCTQSGWLRTLSDKDECLASRRTSVESCNSRQMAGHTGTMHESDHNRRTATGQGVAASMWPLHKGVKLPQAAPPLRRQPSGCPDALLQHRPPQPQPAANARRVRLDRWTHHYASGQLRCRQWQASMFDKVAGQAANQQGCTPSPLTSMTCCSESAGRVRANLACSTGIDVSAVLVSYRGIRSRMMQS